MIATVHTQRKITHFFLTFAGTISLIQTFLAVCIPSNPRIWRISGDSASIISYSSFFVRGMSINYDFSTHAIAASAIFALTFLFGLPLLWMLFPIGHRHYLRRNIYGCLPVVFASLLRILHPICISLIVYFGFNYQSDGVYVILFMLFISYFLSLVGCFVYNFCKFSFPDFINVPGQSWDYSPFVIQYSFFAGIFLISELSPKLPGRMTEVFVCYAFLIYFTYRFCYVYIYLPYVRLSDNTAHCASSLMNFVISSFVVLDLSDLLDTHMFIFLISICIIPVLVGTHFIIQLRHQKIILMISSVQKKLFMFQNYKLSKLEVSSVLTAVYYDSKNFPVLRALIGRNNSNFTFCLSYAYCLLNDYDMCSKKEMARETTYTELSMVVKFLHLMIKNSFQQNIVVTFFDLALLQILPLYAQNDLFHTCSILPKRFLSHVYAFWNVILLGKKGTLLTISEQVLTHYENSLIFFSIINQASDSLKLLTMFLNFCPTQIIHPDPETYTFFSRIIISEKTYIPSIFSKQAPPENHILTLYLANEKRAFRAHLAFFLLPFIFSTIGYAILLSNEVFQPSERKQIWNLYKASVTLLSDFSAFQVFLSAIPQIKYVDIDFLSLSSFFTTDYVFKTYLSNTTVGVLYLLSRMEEHILLLPDLIRSIKNSRIRTMLPTYFFESDFFPINELQSFGVIELIKLCYAYMSNLSSFSASQLVDMMNSNEYPRTLKLFNNLTECLSSFLNICAIEVPLTLLHEQQNLYTRTLIFYFIPFVILVVIGGFIFFYIYNMYTPIFQHFFDIPKGPINEMLTDPSVQNELQTYSNLSTLHSTTATHSSIDGAVDGEGSNLPSSMIKFISTHKTIVRYGLSILFINLVVFGVGIPVLYSSKGTIDRSINYFLEASIVLAQPIETLISLSNIMNLVSNSLSNEINLTNETTNLMLNFSKTLLIRLKGHHRSIVENTSRFQSIGRLNEVPSFCLSSSPLVVCDSFLGHSEALVFVSSSLFQCLINPECNLNAEETHVLFYQVAFSHITTSFPDLVNYYFNLGTSDQYGTTTGALNFIGIWAGSILTIVLFSFFVMRQFFQTWHSFYVLFSSIPLSALEYSRQILEEDESAPKDLMESNPSLIVNKSDLFGNVGAPVFLMNKSHEIIMESKAASDIFEDYPLHGADFRQFWETVFRRSTFNYELGTVKKCLTYAPEVKRGMFFKCLFLPLKSFSNVNGKINVKYGCIFKDITRRVLLKRELSKIAESIQLLLSQSFPNFFFPHYRNPDLKNTPEFPDSIVAVGHFLVTGLEYITDPSLTKNIHQEVRRLLHHDQSMEFFGRSISFFRIVCGLSNVHKDPNINSFNLAKFALDFVAFVARFASDLSLSHLVSAQCGLMVQDLKCCYTDISSTRPFFEFACNKPNLSKHIACICPKNSVYATEKLQYYLVSYKHLFEVSFQDVILTRTQEWVNVYQVNHRIQYETMFYSTTFF